MYGGQNNLATLHDKVNMIADEVHDIKESNGITNTNNVGLFGGERPMANVFLEHTRNGGGILENIGNFFTGTTSSTEEETETVEPTIPIRPSIPVRKESVNTELPDPSSIVNKPVNTSLNSATNTQYNTSLNSEGVGGKNSLVNSLFGGYKPTKRNMKYLKKYKKGQSIGFTMRASLKAKGLIPRSNGTRRISKKYRG